MIKELASLSLKSYGTLHKKTYVKKKEYNLIELFNIVKLKLMK